MTKPKQPQSRLRLNWLSSRPPIRRVPFLALAFGIQPLAFLPVIRKATAWLVASLLTFATASSLHAQSTDALLNKLVEKGILTVKEANELREEADKNFSEAYSVKSGMPDWVTALKFNGDFRGRFEQNNAESDLYHTRDRFRYRVRFGVTASMIDNFDIGFRLASGNPQTVTGGTLVGGQPITANTDLGSLESRKFVWVDNAFARWTPLNNADWMASAVIGKFDNPFQLSNMIYDYDIEPEGGALQLSRNFCDIHVLKGVAAFFVLDEINQGVGTVPSINPEHDPFLYGGQMWLESHWATNFDTSLGVAVMNIAYKDSLSALAQPFYNSGNTRLTNGVLKYNYNPIIGTAAATFWLDQVPFYSGRFPIKLLGEYMVNPAAPANNTAWRSGIDIGRGARKNTWEIFYRYQDLEADSWFDAMVDDDNGAFYAAGNPQLVGTGKASGWFGGTNVRGHLVQFNYFFTDYLNFAFTWYRNDLIIGNPTQPSTAGHFMTDLMWRF
jgi:hypothetical protein